MASALRPSVAAAHSRRGQNRTFSLQYDWFVSVRQNVRDFFHGMAYGQYERELRRQAAELNDLFLLLCYMEIVGLPNPATLYLLDVYPYLLDQFHLWHRRMGMDRSPVGNLPCC